MSLSAEAREALQTVAARMMDARSILFITGAGLSADSDLPTYRGVGGLYNDEHTTEGIPIEEALSGTMLARRPEIAWGHISRIEMACRDALFNRGHQVIAHFEKALERVWVLTQNVDGFHRKAGSRNVIDIHGDVSRLLCTVCPWTEEVEDFSHLTELPPKCPVCGGLVRPDVVLFGEMLPEQKLNTLLREGERGFDMVFSVGTSALFPYIYQPVVQAAQMGVPTVEIDPGETDLSDLVAHRVKARAAVALDYLWSLLPHHHEAV